jgi:hypothetical protein
MLSTMAAGLQAPMQTKKHWFFRVFLCQNGSRVSATPQRLFGIEKMIQKAIAATRLKRPIVTGRTFLMGFLFGQSQAKAKDTT